MEQLLKLQLEDDKATTKLRRVVAKCANDWHLQLELACGLGRCGNSREAATILRPLRKHWKAQPMAEEALQVLAVQTWWNKNSRNFIQMVTTGRHDDALSLLGERFMQLWDEPGLIMHLGGIAGDRAQFDVSNHAYRRVQYLAERGVPKINMTAFKYVAPAALIDNLLAQGKPDVALQEHNNLKANPGNAMSHEMRKAVLTVAVGQYDEAMQLIAKMSLTAEKHRRGYGKVLRKNFIDSADELAPLRERDDWTAMLADPASYAKR